MLEPDDDDFHDLVEAGHSSMDFWDNSPDDEDWNEQERKRPETNQDPF